jgi:tRNA threonylcarbamoyladenosine biosynthesis protein TsaB
VALLDEEALLAEFTLNIRKTHSERLMPLIDALLKESAVEREQLQAVAVAAGPGSFTGIRIGVSTARALAQGLAIPAVGVSTLQALAEAVPSPGALVCPLLDARRNEVYSALYRREAVPPSGLEMLIPPAAVELGPFTERLKVYGEPIVFTGEGLNSYGLTSAKRWAAWRSCRRPRSASAAQPGWRSADAACWLTALRHRFMSSCRSTCDVPRPSADSRSEREVRRVPDRNH